MVSKTGEAENITSHYLFALGLYRGMYLINWIYRYYDDGHFDAIAVVAGVVQTLLYADFFYLYVTKGQFHTHRWCTQSECFLLDYLLSTLDFSISFLMMFLVSL